MASDSQNPVTHPDNDSNRNPTNRTCGACSLCCVVLRVDEISKLAGTPCQHIHPGGGCAIHEIRPQICRGYECLWLRGKLRDDDRPDRLGAVIDLVPVGSALRLSIRQARPGAFDRSARLQQIADEFRESMPVRITDVDDVLDADRPFRVLLADGEEQIVSGDAVRFLRHGTEVDQKRLSWIERIARRAAIRWRAFRIRQSGAR